MKTIVAMILLAVGLAACDVPLIDLSRTNGNQHDAGDVDTSAE